MKDRRGSRTQHIYRSSSWYPEEVGAIRQFNFPVFIERFRIRRKRPSLRLIVSSATLDATSLLDYFTSGNNPDDATIVSLEGRMYPVEVAYLEDPTPDYVKKAAEVAWRINLQVRCTTQSSCSLAEYRN